MPRWSMNDKIFGRIKARVGVEDPESRIARLELEVLDLKAERDLQAAYIRRLKKLIPSEKLMRE